MVLSTGLVMALSIHGTHSLCNVVPDPGGATRAGKPCFDVRQAVWLLLVSIPTPALVVDSCCAGIWSWFRVGVFPGGLLSASGSAWLLSQLCSPLRENCPAGVSVNRVFGQLQGTKALLKACLCLRLAHRATLAPLQAPAMKHASRLWFRFVTLPRPLCNAWLVLVRVQTQRFWPACFLLMQWLLIPCYVYLCSNQACCRSSLKLFALFWAVLCCDVLSTVS